MAVDGRPAGAVGRRRGADRARRDLGAPIGRAAGGVDGAGPGRRRGDVHAGDLAGRPAADAAGLRHVRQLSLDRRRQGLGDDPLPAAHRDDASAAGLASHRPRHRLRGQRPWALEDDPRPGEDLEHRAGGARPGVRHRDRPRPPGVDAGRRRRRAPSLDRRRPDLEAGRDVSRPAPGPPFRPDQPGARSDRLRGHRSRPPPLRRRRRVLARTRPIHRGPGRLLRRGLPARGQHLPPLLLDRGARGGWPHRRRDLPVGRSRRDLDPRDGPGHRPPGRG